MTLKILSSAITALVVSLLVCRPASAVVILPDSISGVTLQAGIYGGQSSFLLPVGGSISNVATAVVGNNSKNWLFENRGSITSTDITGNSGIQMGSLDKEAAQVNNYGSITSNGNIGSAASGIRFTNGGRVYNYAGGYISGFDGVHTDGGSLLVDNYGTIESTHASGIYSGQGMLVYNREGGEILSPNFGINSNGPLRSFIYNYGLISSSTNSVDLTNGGDYSLYNAPGATIVGGNRAVRFDGNGGQILNAGTLQSTSPTGITMETTSDGNSYANTGLILSAGGGTGFKLNGNNNILYNLGEISGSSIAINIVGDGNLLVLGQQAYLPKLDMIVVGPGPTIAGAVNSTGNNSIRLTESGALDSAFTGFSNLTMLGADWSLGGSFNLLGTAPNSLNVLSGRLLLSGSVTSAGGATVGNGGLLQVGDAPGSAASLQTAGPATVLGGGTLGGYGTITADVHNFGTLGAFTAAQPGRLSVLGDVLNLGAVNLRGSTPGNSLLVTGDYTGGAGSRLLMSAALAGDASPSDVLIIDTGQALGQTGIVMVNNGGRGRLTRNGIPVILLQNGAVSPAGGFHLAAPAAAGMYKYFLRQNPADQQWYLHSTRRAEPGAYLANIHNAVRMFQHSMHDRQWLDATPQGRRLWVRSSGSTWRDEAFGGIIGMKGDSMQFQAGVDAPVGSLGNGDTLYLGAMSGYGRAWSHSRINSAGGGGSWDSGGEFDAFAAGVYATWLANSQTNLGTYVDAWAQYSLQNNSVHGDDMITNRYRTDLYSLSLELGYALEVLPEKKLVLTPQGQATLHYYDAGDIHEDFSDTRVDGSATIFSTRLGLRAESSFAVAGRLPSDAPFMLTPFVEANWVHAPTDLEVAINETHVETDAAKNMGELKVGMDLGRVDGLSFRIQAESRFDGNEYRSLGGTVGLQYTW